MSSIQLNLPAIFMLILSVVFSANVIGNDASPEIVIEHRHTQPMQFENLKRIDIGNPDVITVSTEPGDTNFILFGQQPGKTDITLWGSNGEMRRYLVRVKGNPRLVERRQLIFKLAHIEGVVVEQEGDQFYIDGEVRTADDFEMLQTIVSSYDNVDTNLFAPEFDDVKSIRMRARYIEINRTALKNIGIAWNELSGGPFFGIVKQLSGSPFVVNVNVNGEQTNGAYSGINASANSTINFLLENGNARVLKEQSILVNSGSEGRVFTGGEFPIRTRDENGQIVTSYKPYGLTLQLTPTVNKANRIHAQLSLEMTSLDSSFGGENPAIRVSETQTQLTFTDGEAVIVSNFMSQDDSKHVAKLPGLGQIPVFGELFKSRQFANNRSELYIVLEPEVVDSTHHHGTNAFISKRSDIALAETRFKLLD